MCKMLFPKSGCDYLSFFFFSPKKPPFLRVLESKEAEQELVLPAWQAAGGTSTRLGNRICPLTCWMAISLSGVSDYFSSHQKKKKKITFVIFFLTQF